MTLCIPTYEMGGYGHNFLKELFIELKHQTFTDFDIVVSDQSSDNKVLDVCDAFSSVYKIDYFKDYYNKGKAACNINNAMRIATGEVLKIIYQDDFFVNENALEIIYDKFKNGAKWVVNGFTHSHDKKQFSNTKIPFYGDHVLLGENTIGNPSNVAVLNCEKIYMDESILYVVDCEYYFRMKQKLGLPTVVDDILVCARHHPASAVDKPEFYSLKDGEVKYCLKKHNVEVR
jgi:hypothetical protein